MLLGIDAGGTKTLAILADRAGQMLARGEAGPANYQSAGREAALAALSLAVERALAAAGAQREQVQAICLGAAGADRPEDRGIFEDWAAQACPNARSRITNDALIVLYAGTPAGWGLALISGTGSIAYGRHPGGQLARAGGWGYLLGDEGSGYAIGLAALRAAARAADGRGPHTALLADLLAYWQLDGPTRLVRKVYGELAGAGARAEIARLARIVEQAAAQGDAVSAAILREAGQELALAAGAVVDRLAAIEPGSLPPGPLPCALTGGVLVKGTRVREEFLAAAAARGLALAPVTLVPEPALGAVRLAQELF
jgi:N-acetylglucosamine kinase-like BadF-type ATPase